MDLYFKMFRAKVQGNLIKRKHFSNQPIGDSSPFGFGMTHYFSFRVTEQSEGERNPLYRLLQSSNFS